MKTMSITDFKAHALQVIGQVSECKEAVVVTKRGKPVAGVVPYSEPKPVEGRLAEALVFEGDIVAPLGGDMWNVCT